jgi:hypothetical protein
MSEQAIDQTGSSVVLSVELSPWARAAPFSVGSGLDAPLRPQPASTNDFRWPGEARLLGELMNALLAHGEQFCDVDQPQKLRLGHATEPYPETLGAAVPGPVDSA